VYEASSLEGEAMKAIRYCCPAFRYADKVNKIFDRMTDENGEIVVYTIKSDSIVPMMGIRYCPWCAEEAPLELP
jgi:hypothetical protein